MTKVGETGGQADAWKELGTLGVAEALIEMAGADADSRVEDK